MVASTPAPVPRKTASYSHNRSSTVICAVDDVSRGGGELAQPQAIVIVAISDSSVREFGVMGMHTSIRHGSPIFEPVDRFDGAAIRSSP